MTLGEGFGLSSARERLLVRALQLVLLGMVVYGVVTLAFGIALNGALALAVTLLPAALRREYRYSMDAGLVLWITVAVLLNALGVVELYVRWSWYDEVTHMVSATIVAGLGYAALRAFERHSAAIDLTTAFREVFVVVFVVAFGVVWEVFEFGAVVLAGAVGAPPPVTVFGVDDIATDMAFNTVGGVVVALWGRGYFGGVASFLGRRLRSVHED